MTDIFNHPERKVLRQTLRRDAPDAEVIMWSRLQRSQLGGHKFRRQASIDRYVVDFYCPRLKLIIEIDGNSHFTDEGEEYDKVRTEFLEALGLHIIRFKNDDVYKRLPVVLEEIVRAADNLKTTPASAEATPPS